MAAKWWWRPGVQQRDRLRAATCSSALRGSDRFGRLAERHPLEMPCPELAVWILTWLER